MKPNMPGSPLQESLAYSDKITLKYFQNSFMLDFSTLDYSDNGQIKYMYWLENYDKIGRASCRERVVWWV